MVVGFVLVVATKRFVLQQFKGQIVQLRSCLFLTLNAVGTKQCSSLAVLKRVLEWRQVAVVVVVPVAVRRHATTAFVQTRESRELFFGLDATLWA